MVSTYSDLKIQLMATGDEDTTWGDVSNLNWEAMEEAISGSVDVPFSSGNVTLSLTDSNAAQSARNMRLNCTGTTGGARNLVIPSIEKLYLVNNGCADAITVKTSAGTGIAVAAGKTMWVYSNATNVVDAVTHLTSLTLGSALPVASGGTGTTTSTGTGSTVLSASPTFTGTVAGAALNFTGNATIGGELSVTGTAWTSYTPTVTSGSGTITSYTASGKYKLIGKTIFLKATIAITAAGTGAGALIITLPGGVTSAGAQAVDGYNFTAGKAMAGSAGTAGTSTLSYFHYDATTPIITNYSLMLSAVIEVQ